MQHLAPTPNHPELRNVCYPTHVQNVQAQGGTILALASQVQAGTSETDLQPNPIFEEEAQKLREAMRDLEDKCTKSEFENRQKEVRLLSIASPKTFQGSSRSSGERQRRLSQSPKRAEIEV